MNAEEAKTALSYGKYIALDTESTNFQPNDNYGMLLEIGAVKVINGQIVDRFDKLINPGISISKRIQDLTGITNEMVKNEPSYIEVLTEFRKWCDTDEFVLIMHNAPHDLKFLNYFGKKCGISFENDPFIDTQPLAKNILHGDFWKNYNSRIKENYKLSSLAIFFGIDDKNHHRADNDAEVTYKVFEKLKQVAFKRQKDLVYYQLFKYPVKSENKTKTKDVKVVSICPWDKKERIYIKLATKKADEDVYATVFYDFEYNNWKIKEAGFSISSFTELERKVKELYKTTEMQFKNFKDKKYPSCFIKMD